MVITTILKIFKKHWIEYVTVLISVVILFTPYSDSVKVVFIDVGQGDSILIQQGNFQILVDGGPDASILFEISKYMPAGDMEIEVVVLTHPHADHLQGLLDVLDRYKVGEVWVNSTDYDLEQYRYFNSLDLKFVEVKEGDVLKYRDLEIEVLYPFYEEMSFSNINNESIVLELSVFDNKILLMGDAEKEVEELLVENNSLKNVDILKAGHHCSVTASSECFLEIVKPVISICSYGEDNKFGHPHDETLKRFENYNVQYLATEKEGNIVFTFRE